MNNQEQPYYNDVAEQVGVHQAMNNSLATANQVKQQQYAIEEAEKTLAESQLDCEITLGKAYHLLRQDVLKLNDEGILEWEKITDEKKRVLTDEGVDKIMQTLQFYINKETLLSNFDDKQIARRMLEFSLALSANLFMKYEIYFRVPSLDECKDVLKARIENKIKHKMISFDIAGLKADEVAIRREVLKEMESRIEYELSKIRAEQIKTNLREFELLFVELKALVESTHNRAWKGEERGSLRRHFNISEVIGGKPTSQQNNGGSWFGWGKS